MFDSGRPWGILQGVRPQTHVILAKGEKQVSWLDSNFLSPLDSYHWPEIFLLLFHDDDSSTITKRNLPFKVKFLCWYCSVNAQDHYWKMPLKVTEPSCFIGPSNCSTTSQHTVATNVIDSGAHLWTLPNSLGTVTIPPNVDPFFGRRLEVYTRIHTHINRKTGTRAKNNTPILTLSAMTLT